MSMVASESSLERIEGIPSQEIPKSIERAQLSMDALLQITRGERDLEQGESLTGFMVDLVSTMPPEQRTRHVEDLVTKRLYRALGSEEKYPKPPMRGHALLAMAVIADRIRYTTNTTDIAAARLVGMSFFASMASDEAARLVGGDGANTRTLRSLLTVTIGKVKKKGWEEIAPRLQALLEDPDTRPEQFMELHTEIAASATKLARRDRLLGKAAIASRQKPADAPMEPFLEEEITPIRRIVSRDAFSDYLRQIGTISLLNHTTEIVLAQRIEAGLMAEHILSSEVELVAMAEQDMRASGAFADEIPAQERHRAIAQLRRDLQIVVCEGEAARERFINANLRLVVTMAQRKSKRQVPMIELVQYGNEGVVEAVDDFDYKRGYKFSTYAAWKINKRINLGIHEYSQSTKISIDMFHNLSKLMAIEPQLMVELGRAPTAEEFSKAMDGLPVKKVEKVMKLKAHSPISLATPVAEDLTLIDVLADKPGDNSVEGLFEAAEAKELRESMEKALAHIPERDAAMLRYRFGFEDGKVHNHREVSEVSGLSKERVRQLEIKWLKYFREEFPWLRTILGD